MKIKIFSMGTVLLFALAFAWAADISGKWIAQAQDVEIKLDFKVSGSTFTGTLENPQAGAPVEIKEGKINGDEISFYVVRNMNDTEMKISWKGKVAGNEIKFKREAVGGAGGPAMDIVAKRAN
jgi:hypothetical protein